MPWKKYKGITRFEPAEFPENPEEQYEQKIKMLEDTIKELSEKSTTQA